MSFHIDNQKYNTVYILNQNHLHKCKYLLNILYVFINVLLINIINIIK